MVINFVDSFTTDWRLDSLCACSPLKGSELSSMIDCCIVSEYCRADVIGLWKAVMLRGIEVILEITRVARLNLFRPIGELDVEVARRIGFCRYCSVRMAVGFGSVRRSAPRYVVES